MRTLSSLKVSAWLSNMSSCPVALHTLGICTFRTLLRTRQEKKKKKKALLRLVACPRANLLLLATLLS